MWSDAHLYARGAQTLVASWEADARGASGASVVRAAGVAAAVFPDEPERAVFNNALLKTGMTQTERANALNAMEAAYSAAGVTRFAAWVHERDEATAAALETRGYVLDTCTRAMGMALEEIRLARPDVALAAPEWYDHLRILGLPSNFLAEADRAVYRILVAQLDGENVATATAFDFGGDCGIYDVTTLEHARRRGLGTALTSMHLHDALLRGCETASVQSTFEAERMYTSIGFRDLGRILEYVPRTPDQPEPIDP